MTMNNRLILKYSTIMMLCFVAIILAGSYASEGLNSLTDSLMKFSLWVAGISTVLMVISEEVLNKQRGYFKQG